MKTTKVLQTNISETNILEVSDMLNTSTKNRIAICNANTLVRSVRNVEIRNSINNFTIKTPDGFPVARALSFLTKQKFSRVDGYKVFIQTIENGLSRGTKHYFFGSSDEITQLMINKLTEKFPDMKIAGENKMAKTQPVATVKATILFSFPFRFEVGCSRPKSFSLGSNLSLPMQGSS